MNYYISALVLHFGLQIIIFIQQTIFQAFVLLHSSIIHIEFLFLYFLVFINISFKILLQILIFQNIIWLCKIIIIQNICILESHYVFLSFLKFLQIMVDSKFLSRHILNNYMYLRKLLDIILNKKIKNVWGECNPSTNRLTFHPLVIFQNGFETN